MKKDYTKICKYCGKSPIRIIKGKDNKCMTCKKIQKKEKTASERIREKQEAKFK